MGWTKEQQRAIESESGNILVAASAGSGKTAVLTERILSHIFPEDPSKQVDINRMLVITFTEDAAREMKSRIERKLRKKGREASKDDNDIAEKIFRQQTLLAGANIQTLHAFCNSVCKMYPMESLIPQGARLLEDKEKTAFLRTCFEKTAEKYYGKKNPGFEILCNIYVDDSSDEKLFCLVSELAESIHNHVNGKKWLYDSLHGIIADPLSDEFRYNIVYREFINLIETEKNLAVPFLCKIAERAAYHSMSAREEKLRFIIKKYIEAAEMATVESGNSVSVIMEIREILERKQDSTGKDNKKNSQDPDCFDYDKKIIDNVLKNAESDINKLVGILPEDPEELPNEYGVLEGTADILYEFTLAVAEEYETEKKKQFCLDFSDMEEGALRVLCKKDENGNILYDGKGNPLPSEIAEIYRNKFLEVYVDEYQDINNVQNTIIHLVSSTDTEKPNLFTVGDMKQSIYGFRGSNPDMFLKQEREYSENNPEGSSGELVRLNCNFRSRNGVIQGINRVFDRLMTEETSDIDYRGNERLVFGAAFYDEDRERKCSLVFDNEDDYIVKKIKELTEKGEVSVEKEGRRVKVPTEPRHIAILCRKNDEVARTVAVLRANGINAVSAEGDVILTGCEEVALTLDFLKIAENTKNDRMIYSVMRSAYGSFSEEELAEIRMRCDDRKSTFYDCCRSVSKENNYLGRKVSRFFETVNEIRRLSVSERVADLIWRVVNIHGFYAGCSESGKSNLQRLYFKADEFEKTKDKGLYLFVKYVSNPENTDSWKVSQSNMNAVSVMTVHKSKGLEFPVVFLLMKSNRAGDSGDKSELCMGGDRIIIRTSAGKAPFPYRLTEYLKTKNEQKEAIRLLYVAMTRAGEELYCVCKKRYKEEERNLLESGLVGGEEFDSYVISHTTLNWQWILKTITDEKGETDPEWYVVTNTHEDDTSETEQGQDTENKENKENKENEEPDTGKAQEEGENNEENGSFEYEIHALKDTPVKISVSEIKKLREKFSPSDDSLSLDILEKEKDKQEIVAPSFGRTAAVSGAGKGTLTHLLLQYIDFTKAGEIVKEHGVTGKEAFEKTEELISGTVADLVRRNLLTEEDAGEINTYAVKRFLLSDKAKRMFASKEIHRETAFTLLMPWNLITGNQADDETDVSVQGVIDCWFTEDEGIVIYDYKTDFVTEENQAEKERLYKPQLECYSRAVEKITGRKVLSTELIFLGKC